jgi:hypothetical protein
VVERYGPFIGIGPAQLDRAERQIQGHGALAVVLGRRLPGLRVLTSVGCGIFRAPYRVFLPAMSLGSIIYIAGYTMLGLRSWADGARIVRSVVPADWAGWLWWPADAPAGCADRYPARLTTSASPGRRCAPGSGTEWGCRRPASQSRRPADAPPDGGCRGARPFGLASVRQLAGSRRRSIGAGAITRCHGRPTVAGDATSNWCRLGAVYALWTEPRLPGPGRGARASVCVRAVPRERWVTGAVCSYK